MSTSTVSDRNTSRLGGPSTFSDHIGELRLRLSIVALVFVVSSAVAYNFRDVLVSIVMAPLGSQKLIFLTPAGGFAFIIQITMYVGAVVTAPLLMYHIYKFVHPALPARARKYSVRIFLLSTTLMLGGVTFGYYVAVPAALTFLNAFAGDFVDANLTADSYLQFVVAYVVGLGLLFQLPLLLVFWNWIRPLAKGALLSSQQFIIVGAFIAAAIITPTPDVINQALVAGPIIVVYQFGVIAVYIINRAQRKRAATQSNVAPAELMDVESRAHTAVPIPPTGRARRAVDGIKSPAKRN